MRVGKKTNVVIDKKTRSCVVRLEKFRQKTPSSAAASPIILEESQTQRITRNNRLSLTAMGATPKGRKVATIQQEEKTSRGAPIKKRPVENSGSNPQTPQQKLSASSTANMSSIRSNQKIKIIPRSTNKVKTVATPIRDETPPPTVAAGRSRRAIKPNPKYNSEDVVTPKAVRNVGMGSSGSGKDAGKYRKMSSSSDDFYNRNSDDDFENDINEDDDDEDEDLQNDKAYQANEKEDLDSDFSDVEVVPMRAAVRPRGRPRKQPLEPTQTSTPQSTTVKHMTTPTPVSIIKRTTAANNTNLRSAPSQLQQIRRSLASANAQRNQILISNAAATAQKRKLDDTQDSSENESSYTTTTTARKQMLLTSAAGVKVKVPVKDNKTSSTTTSTPLTNKSRVLGMQKISATSTPQQQQQTLNGGNKMNSSRKIIEIPAQKSSSDKHTKTAMRSVPNRQATTTNAETYVNNKSNTSNLTQQQTPTTHAKMFVGKSAASSNKVRSRSPKPPTATTQKDTQSNKSSSATSATTSSTQNPPKKLPTLNSNRLGNDKTKLLSSNKSSTNTNTSSSSNSNTTTTATANHTKTKSSSQSPASASAKTSLTSEKLAETQEDSPNSTMDDFETMPTFTIVNVNDIINKKGDVLITKSKSNINKPTVIEFSESISLDDDDDDEEDESLQASTAIKPAKSLKLPTANNKKDFDNKKSPLARSNESLRKTTLPTKANSAATNTSTTAPQILNHKLGLRNKKVTPKTTTTLTLTPPADKPAPRILNSMVAKKTQPVKPMIANLDDSADESFPLSLDEDEEEEETEDEVESKTISKTLMTEKGKDLNHPSNREVDTEDTESQNTEEDDSMIQASNALTPKLNTIPTTTTQRKRKGPTAPIVVSSNKKRLTPAAAKENSLAATNQQVQDTKTLTTTTPQRKNADKVVISKQGDKIIKKITCFETWYVINMPLETKRHSVMKNQLEMPLIRLANNATLVELPTDLWSCKVTLYELTASTLAKSTMVTYTGDLSDHNINEEDRAKYQPSCVMFRRSVDTRISSRMPYDRAVIFKNKTFYTNIEGKNVRLVGAPSIINTEKEIEILLEVVDNLTLQSDFVEHVSIVQ